MTACAIACAAAPAAAAEGPALPAWAGVALALCAIAVVALGIALWRSRATVHRRTAALVGLDTRLRRLADNVPARLAYIDRDYRVAYANQPYARFFEVERDGLTGTPVAQLLGEQTFERWRPHVDRALAGETFDVEEEWDYGPRGRRWMLDTFVPDVDPDGTIPGAFCLMFDVTERHRALLTERAAEQRFHDLIEGSIAAILIEADDRALFVNRSFVELHGFDSPEEIYALDSLDSLTAPHDRVRLRGYSEARMRGEPAPVRYEFEALRRDGSTMTLESLVRIVEWDGRFAIQSTLVDVTEARQAQRALALSEARFRGFAESAADWFWEMDERLRFSYVAGRFRETLGVDAGAIVGKTRAEFYGWLAGDAARAEHEALLDARQPFDDRDIRWRRPDGEPRVLSVSGRPVFDARGRFAGYRGVVRDVTVERGAERALRESEERFRNLVEGSLQGIFIHARGRTLFANQAYAEMLGYDSPGEVEAEPTFRTQIAPYDRDRLRRYGEARLRGEPAPTEYEYDSVRRDGSIVTLLAAVRVVQWRGERAFQSTVVDITERKRAEHALELARDDLERKVEERTRELRDANERLAALDRLKSMFIASMSHELRTPLNAIIGFTGVLLQGMSGPLNERQHDQLGRVNGAAKHLLELISDVIDISKIEAGRIDVETEDFALEDVVGAAVDALRADAERKGLDIEVSVPPELTLHSDRKRVLQCLLNLVSNAVKFTERGRIRIVADASDGIVSVSVADTGIGISDEDLPRVFKPFERMESKLRMQTPGTGLGLYLTKKIAGELLGGDVDVRSEAGRGSTFVLSVPGALGQTRSTGAGNG